MDILSLISLENGVKMIFEIKQKKLWFEMDEPWDKDMIVNVYEVPSDTCVTGKETAFHQSALGVKHMLRPGTYVFTFSNDQYTHFTVIFINNKMSFEVN